MKVRQLSVFAMLLMVACHDPNPTVTPVVVRSSEKFFTTITFTTALDPELKQNIQGLTMADSIFPVAFSGTDLSALKANFTFAGEKVFVGDIEQKSGVTVNDFSKPVTYVVHAEDGSTEDYTVKFVDTGWPALYISTNNVPIVSKESYVVGTLKVTQGLEADVLFEGTLNIRGRGNSTWGMPKKPYRIKLEEKLAFLNLKSGKNFTLLANYADKTLMRNQLAFQLSRLFGMNYTPSCQFAEVILNGEYIGNYLITDQIRVGKDNVNVEEQDDGATTLPEISGGYLVEEDGFAESEAVHFYTPRNMPFSVKYPDSHDITGEQINYITNHIGKFEAALFSENFIDPDQGYRRYFDVDSYVDYYIINEVMGNPDMFWSTYYYKKRNDDHLYAGPVWDFDIAGNNDLRLGDAVNKLMATSAHDPKMWINRLMQDVEFRRRIRSRWNEKKHVIDDMPSLVDMYQTSLYRSQEKNFIRWDILGQRVYLEYQVAGSFGLEVDFLRNYFNSRIPWLDAKFNGSDYQ